MGDSRPGLRGRKKLVLRQSLEDLALRLFAERGFDNVTVDTIAEAAMVSSRTFFRYFGSKEEVILAPYLEMRRVLAGALADRPPDEPVLDALCHALGCVAQYLEAHRPQLARRVEIVRTTPVVLARAVQQQENLRGVLTQFAAARLGADPTTDLRPHVAVGWAMAGLSAARALWEHGASERDLPSLLAEAYELLLADLRGTLA